MHNILLRAKFANDSNVLVREIGRGRGVQEHSLEIAEVNCGRRWWRQKAPTGSFRQHHWQSWWDAMRQHHWPLTGSGQTDFFNVYRLCTEFLSEYCGLHKELFQKNPVHLRVVRVSN